MKKVSAIILVVLALSVISVPVLAQTAELSLKYWHAGVGGADLWVADYQVEENLYEYDEYGNYEDTYVLSTEKLVLQPGMGGSLILSGSYSLSPSASVGISYWGLSRADTVGVEFIDKYGSESVGDEGEYWLDKHYWLTVPWWERNFSFDRDRFDYAGSDLDGMGVLVAEGNLSMSALDIFGAKTLVGSGWEVAFSGGIRRAIFSQDEATGLELSGGVLTEEGFEYVTDSYYYYGSQKWNLDLDSKLSISAIGPQVGIDCKYALGDKLVLKAGAKAGVLFGTATADAIWSVDHWCYREVIESGSPAPFQADESPYEWVLYESMDVPYSAVNSVQINTFDLSASLGYQVTEQLSVEAGYYASLWKGVPSLYFLNYNNCPNDDPFDSCNFRRWTWDQPEARDVVVSGLTVGVNFKF